MHLPSARVLGAVLVACASGALLPAGAGAATSAERSARAWDRLSRAELAGRTAGKRTAVAPEAFAAFALDRGALGDVLEDAPGERSGRARLVVSVPTPDGDLERFAIKDSPVMSPGLAAQHPEIRTFAGRGVEDRRATIRLDLMPSGFHASVRRPGGGYFVDPRAFGDGTDHVAYDRGAVPEADKDPFSVEDGAAEYGETTTNVRSARAAGEPVTLRRYRLALVSDPSYATGTPGTTTEAKVALINRVNQVYEADLAVRLELIAGNDALNLDLAALATGADGPCGEAPCFPAVSDCSAVLDRNIYVAGILAGARNFDLGHIVLGNAGGGVAYFGVGEALKAGGCTGKLSPVGDAFAVDYVAHEMGHQFYGSHTFNGTEGSCSGGNRDQPASVEPGSGSSIQAYAGICDADDLQDHSDPYFSQRSIAEASTQVTKPPRAESAEQEVVLRDFNGGDTFRVSYDGGEPSEPISFTDATGVLSVLTLEQRIESVLRPAGATATVAGPGGAGLPDATGFAVTFGGSLGGSATQTLEVVDAAGLTGSVHDIVVGGPATNGGTPSTPGNHHPDVTAPPDATIPVRTPFRLTATGSDLDGDPLTYLWEQNDPGTGTGTGLVSPVKTNGPLFRVFGTAARYSDADAQLSPSPGQNAAGPDPSRSFPDDAQVLLDNTNAATGSCPAASVPPTDAQIDCLSESLPTASYGPNTLRFRVTARDNEPGAGGTDHDDVVLTLDKSSGPFRVTSQGAPSSIPEGSNLLVQWGPANTRATTPKVTISLSKDAGATWVPLAANEDNDGEALVALPAGTASNGRIKVSGNDNVFYDLSKAPLTITAGSSPILAATPTSVAFGTVATGSTGESTVTVKNTGSSPATVGSPSIAGADVASFTATGCAGPLAVGAECSVVVRFTPDRTGALSARLEVPSNAASSPLEVALSGTGASPPPPGGSTGTTTTTTTTSTTSASPTPTATAPPATTAPTPTPTAPPRVPAPAPAPSDPVRDALIRILGTPRPRSLGKLGRLDLYAASRSTSLGRPAASRRLLAVVCRKRPCSLTPRATITTKARSGRTNRRTLRFTTLRLTRTGAIGTVTLKLTKAERASIRRATSARLSLRLPSGSAVRTLSYRFRVG